MKTIAISLSAVLFVALSALALSHQDSASAACPSSNSASLSLLSGSMVANEDGTFSYTLVASWNTKGKPFIVAPSIATGTVGVDRIRYLPEYVFPSACTGSAHFRVVGVKTANAAHLVNTQLDVGPRPNDVVTGTATLIP